MRAKWFRMFAIPLLRVTGSAWPQRSPCETGVGRNILMSVDPANSEKELYANERWLYTHSTCVYLSGGAPWVYSTFRSSDRHQTTGQEARRTASRFKEKKMPRHL